jgi:hypothetical protein
MIEVRIEVPLIRVSDGFQVMGWLVNLKPKHIDGFERFWKLRLGTSREGDQYWDWEQKKRVYLRGDSTIYEGYAIECNGIVQGLMLLKMGGHRSWVEPRRRLVYVHALATAPWNRGPTPEPMGFQTVGATLLEFARFRSEELGMDGLVGLHSLPNAEGFYRKMGMWDGGIDLEKEGLRYFEWYSARADWWEEEFDV